MSFEHISLKNEPRNGTSKTNELVEIHNQFEQEDEIHLLEKKVKIEANLDTNNELSECAYANVDNVETKSERNFWEDETDEEDFYLNEAKSHTEELYSDHVITEELVVGPVVFHKPVLTCSNKVSELSDLKSASESFLEEVTTPVEVCKPSQPILKPVDTQKCHENLTLRDSLQITSSMITLGELATSSPGENADLFYAIVKIIDQHYPKNWRNWEVHNITFQELFGESIVPILEMKIKFALPTLDLANAFNFLTTSLTTGKYRIIRNKLIKWPLARALIYTPQWLAMRIHGTSYVDLMNTVKAIKPKLLMTRPLELDHSNINRKRPHPISDINKTHANNPEPLVGTSCTEEGRKQITMLSEVINKTKEIKNKRNETIVYLVKKTAKTWNHLDKSKKKHANSKSINSQEERKMLQAEIAVAEQKLAKLQRINQIRVAQEQAIARADPKMVGSFPESSSNLERKKIIADIERELAKFQKERVRITKQLTKRDSKLAKAIPNRPYTSSTLRKEILRAKITETERKIAKLQRIKKHRVGDESTADPKINVIPDSTSSNKWEEIVPAAIKSAERHLAKVQMWLTPLQGSKEQTLACEDPKLANAIPDNTLRNERVEKLKAKIAKTDREIAKLHKMTEVQDAQEQTIATELNLVSLSSSERMKILLEKLAKAEQDFTNLRLQVTQARSMAEDPKLGDAVPESISSNEQIEEHLAKIAKAKQEYENLQKERFRVGQETQEQSMAEADPKLVNAVPERILSNEWIEKHQAKIAKAKQEYENLEKERFRVGQEQSMAEADPKLVNAVPESTSSNAWMEIRANIAETDPSLAKLQKNNQLQVQEQSMAKPDPKLHDSVQVNSPSNEPMEILLANNAKAKQQYANLQKERLQGTQEQSMTKTDPQLVNALHESSLGKEKTERLVIKFQNPLRVSNGQPIVIAQPKLVNCGRNLQKLGQHDWRDIQFADVRDQLEATPVFTSLKVNDALAGTTQKRKTANILENFDQTLGAITHGLIKQKRIFHDMLKNLPSVVKNEACFVEAKAAFKNTAAAMMKYACGRRAKVLKERRSMYIRKSPLKGILRDIPPSDTHLFDESSLTKAIDEQGGILKFFREASEPEVNKD